MAAKVPELKKQNVQKEAEDGSVVVEERISEFYYFVLEKRWDGMYFLGKKCAIVFHILENPYNGFIDDEVVKSYREEYSGQWDKGADDCGFPDKFVYETVKTYL